jgi:hypothetical protein
MNSVTMKIQMVYDHPYGNPNPKAAWIPGAPEAAAGEILEVLFGVGAALIASDYAEPAPEKKPKPIEAEPVKAKSE